MAHASLYIEAALLCGVPREFLVRKPDTVDDDLVGAHRGWRFEACGSAGCDVIVLVDAITADAESTNQGAVSIQSLTSREKHDAVLIWIRRLRTLCAWVLNVF